MHTPLGTLDGRAILVTGGTGSFGQAFIRQLLKNHRPDRVVVYSRDEQKQQEMAQRVSAPQVRYFIGDVRDVDRLERALNGIDTVIHAAALKIVPAAEYNPIECIKTNVMGAENVINACIAMGIERVVALSTDKAVNPVNLYGATKLCSDKLFIAANHLSGAKGPRFSIVRYGNVIGSRGSVIPLFKERRSQGVLPITDPRMTRFWITLEDGVQLVVRCLSLMRGGEVFVSKTPSMRLVDLANAIAPECRHDVIGVRPGEKLHETLIPIDEAMYTTEFKDYYVIRPAFHLWGNGENDAYAGEQGTPVAEGFELRSDKNNQWLTIEQLRALVGA
jgi:UDP-N-acetylglucosamine 4,6-dehydratase